SDERIASIISNPVINRRYGDFYLKQQIRTFGAKGGLEAALIAYNGGPKRAEEWIKSGFDDSALPAETRSYYKSIMAMLPTAQSGSASAGDPSKVQLVFAERKGLAKLTPQGGEADVNPDLANR